MNGIFLTARLKSTRLPRKVLKEVNGKAVIDYLIKRLQDNIADEKIIICTSTNTQDDELEKIARNNKVDISRGSEEDVLERYYQAALRFNIEKFYIIYGDEPFVDLEIMKKTFNQLNIYDRLFIDNSRLIDGTFGYGMNLITIEYVNKNKTSVKNEVWGRMVSQMDIKIIINEYDNQINSENYRFTIDYPEDFIVFQEIINEVKEYYKKISIFELISIYDKLKLAKYNASRIKDYQERIKLQEKI